MPLTIRDFVFWPPTAELPCCEGAVVGEADTVCFYIGKLASSNRLTGLIDVGPRFAAATDAKIEPVEIIA